MRKMLFDCTLGYLTYAGHERTARFRVEHVAADLALNRAEALLYADKRRHIGALVYGDAVQC